jgi:transcriptional regulator with XRE-family HTH domain
MKTTKAAKAFVVAVGARIRDERKRLGLVQDDFAAKLATDAPTISRVERGNKDLRLSELHQVAVVLGTTPRDLVSVTTNGNGKR